MNARPTAKPFALQMQNSDVVRIFDATSPKYPPADPFDTLEYAAFMNEMATHCRCTRDCPCAGVLAGGLCDGMTDDDRDSLFDDSDDI